MIFFSAVHSHAFKCKTLPFVFCFGLMLIINEPYIALFFD